MSYCVIGGQYEPNGDPYLVKEKHGWEEWR